uniref:Translation initiation factor IF-2-like n=1 Tax=Camelus bactrianus TaxID=9837 RepID=A0A9W3HEB4_CAMBA|nr:translation initiation factor IF-2-like [Camelus bactrianus]
MTIDGPVALFKSSTNCSRAPFSAPGPYCWSGPLPARPGPKPPEAPARAQPCASPRQPAGSQPGSPGAAGDPAAHSSAPRRPSHRRHRYRRRPGRDSATEKQRAPKPAPRAAIEGDTRQGRWGSPRRVGIRVLARPPYRDGPRLPSVCELACRGGAQMWSG